MEDGRWEMVFGLEGEKVRGLGSVGLVLGLGFWGWVSACSRLNSVAKIRQSY